MAGEYTNDIWNDFGTWKSGAGGLNVGRSSSTPMDVAKIYLRFPINITAGSLIETCSFSIVGKGSFGTTENLLIQRINSSSVPALDTATVPGLPVIGPTVTWAQGSWADGTSYTSPNLAQLLQDFINLPGYTSGAFFGVELSYAGATTRLWTMYSGEDDMAKIATLAFTTTVHTGWLVDQNYTSGVQERPPVVEAPTSTQLPDPSLWEPRLESWHPITNDVPEQECDRSWLIGADAFIPEPSSFGAETITLDKWQPSAIDVPYAQPEIDHDFGFFVFEPSTFVQEVVTMDKWFSEIDALPAERDPYEWIGDLGLTSVDTDVVDLGLSPLFIRYGAELQIDVAAFKAGTRFYFEAEIKSVGGAMVYCRLISKSTGFVISELSTTNTVSSLLRSASLPLIGLDTYYVTIGTTLPEKDAVMCRAARVVMEQ